MRPVAEREHIIINRVFNDGTVACEYVKGTNPISREGYEKLPEEEKDMYALYPDVDSKTIHLEGGIILEQDVPVKMRDGITLYTDILRPQTEQKVPVIVAWSPYGKQPRYAFAGLTTKGVPAEALSYYCKLEGPDPAYWCANGYAVANVDIRGTGHSGGNMTSLGIQDARDGYDFVEWIATQDWCNGKVGFAGTSWLAMSQFHIAAAQPPHLACIAPWEGSTDMFRESILDGGMQGAFCDTAISDYCISENYVDDMGAMGRKYPNVQNPYWQDKIVDFEKIEVPVYMTAGWCHFHLRGIMNAFRKISSKEKWLRCHREFEWPDFYSIVQTEDLRHFFDRYLKGICNGWELTPKVRLEVMDAMDLDYQTNRPEKDFPLLRTVYQELYLDASDGSIQDRVIGTESTTEYDAVKGFTTFDYLFEEETEITGYLKLRLWVEAKGNDDMDLFVNIQKVSEEKQEIPIFIFDEEVHPGAWGKLRVSRRKLDKDLSTPFNPVYAFDDFCDKLAPGEVVPVDIEIAPTSRIWHKGEYLRVQIAGHYIRDERWFESLSWDTLNKGTHIIHTGGAYKSFLQIPVIPPRFKSGSYVRR